jgi:hypothetical protein
MAKLLVAIGGVTAVVGVVALGAVTVIGLTSDDPLSIFAIPLLAFGVILVVGILLVFAVIAQGVKNLREPVE